MAVAPFSNAGVAEPQPTDTGRNPSLSSSLLVERCGLQLSEIASTIRNLEVDFLKQRSDLVTPELQMFDLVLQKIEGLSAVLSAAAALLPGDPDPRLDAITVIPRLQVLHDALRGQPARPRPSQVELF